MLCEPVLGVCVLVADKAAVIFIATRVSPSTHPDKHIYAPYIFGTKYLIECLWYFTVC